MEDFFMQRPEDLGRSFERLRLATPAGMELLRESIRREGILSPLSVVLLDERLEVVDGFKRLRIALEQGFELVAVTKLERASKALAVASVLLLNMRAKSVGGLDEALVISALSDEGLNLAEIGEILGRDKSFCSRRLRLARDLDPALIAKVRDGSLPVSIAVMLAVLPRGNQIALSEAILREGLTARETARLIALYASAKGRAAEALLAQPLAALGRQERKAAPETPVQSRGLVQDVARATELLARIVRGLAGDKGPPPLPGLIPALEALEAQIKVLESIRTCDAVGAGV